MKKGYCKECNKQFMSSEYWFLMKKTDFPELCSEHRLMKRNKLRDELLIK
jgi:hypothetical protein